MNQEKTTVTNIATSMREETYLKVMRLLQENPDLTQRELAEQLGVSVGSVNYCLKALMEKGLVKMKNFIHSKNKFGYVYVLTPTGIAERAELTSKFLARKVTEYETLKQEIEILKAEVDGEKDTEQERLAS
jgi:EPS-associated MarR family transcriptional regulator